LPEGAIDSPEYQTTAYTGIAGSTEQSYVQNSKNSFQTTRILSPGEGLTVILKWSKGFIVEPSKLEKILDKNFSTIIAFFGLLGVLFYYIRVWVKVGKDPEKGAVIPIYSPPKDLSPAVLRFIMRMAPDDRSISSAIINLAVKGVIKIKKENKKYILEKNQENPEPKSPLTKGESALFDKLLGKYANSITLDNSNATIIKSAKESFEKTLKKELKEKYFKLNLEQSAIGTFLSIFVVFLSFILTGAIEELMEFFVCIVFIFLGLFLLYLTYDLFKQMLRGKWTNIFRIFFLGIYSVGMISGLTSLIITDINFPKEALFIFLFIAVLNLLFWHLMKAYTIEGRKLMDQIEGFKLFLSATEKDHMNFRNPPEVTPELFEKYLPYAIALEVENKWAEKFNDYLSNIQLTEQTIHYYPAWYYGSSLSHFNSKDFTSDLGNSLIGSFASAAVAPSSSSGFSSGAGFSGGGGGGGGGGGW